MKDFQNEVLACCRDEQIISTHTLNFKAGKSRKLMEKGSSIPGRKVAELSGDYRPFPHREEQEFGRKTPKKSENFPVRNTASMKSTWVYEHRRNLDTFSQKLLPVKADNSYL
jgi:hypothetical protein